MQNTAQVMINSPRQAPGGLCDANANHLARRQPLDAEDRTDHHGVERQRRQRETGARGGRVGHRDIVEDEEQAEEADAEQRHRRPVGPLRPAHAKQERTRQEAEKADPPAQDRQQNRIRAADEIAGDRRGGAAEAARRQRDRNPGPLSHDHLLSRSFPGP
jgi:hypothetical protein